MRTSITSTHAIPNKAIVEPVSVETLGAYLNIEDWKSREVVLHRMILSARSRLELYLTRSLTVKPDVSEFILNGDYAVELAPYVRSVTSVTCKRWDDSTVTLTSDQYKIIAHEVSVLVLDDPSSYKTGTVEYITGYVQGSIELEAVKEAILMMCREIYNGEDPLTDAVKKMVSPLRRVNL